MKISVITPVYNAEKYITQAVESALQFEEVHEVILVEDQSPDNALEVCETLVAKYQERVKLFQHADKGNHGAGASRNLAISKATGDFIAFLDADDYYLPNRFDAERELFKNPTIEGVFGAIGTEFLTEKGKEDFQKKFKNTELTTVKKPAEGNDVFYGLLGLNQDFGTFFHLNGLTIRTESIRKNLLRFNPELRVHQDSDFIVKLSYYCYLKSGNITEAVAMRGVHDDNRITQIQNYSDKYNQRQALLWSSINQWAKDKEIKPEYKDHIHLKNQAFQLSQLSGLKKWITLALAILRNPKILKTRYRFIYLGM